MGQKVSEIDPICLEFIICSRFPADFVQLLEELLQLEGQNRQVSLYIHDILVPYIGFM